MIFCDKHFAFCSNSLASLSAHIALSSYFTALLNNSSALCAKSAHLSSHLISHSSHGQVYSFIFGLHLVGLQLSIAFTDLSGIQLLECIQLLV